MIARMKLRILTTLFSLLSILAPSTALAQEEGDQRDARLEGYGQRVSVVNDSTALIWLLFIFVGAIGLSVLFRDAKRTHLD